MEGEKLLKKVSVVLWSSQAGVVRQFRMITNRTAIVPSFAVKERKIEIETQQKMRTANQDFSYFWDNDSLASQF